MIINWKWFVLFFIVLIVAAIIAIPLWSSIGNNWMGMMGNGFQCPYLFGKYESIGGFIMMFGMFLIPLVLIGLVLLGVAVIVKGSFAPKAIIPMKSCVHCGKPLQADWVNCPYCGKKV
jgi:hypothetical protein